MADSGMKARAGSLCSGAGMLDRAVEELFGAATVWQAETDPAALRVLAHHWPDVPNLGDITEPPGGPYGLPRRHLTAPRRQRQAAKRHARRVRGWREMASPVDILGAGFPCQPFSAAGKRGGSADERHLWPIGVLPGIEALMPPVVVLENVPMLLNIERGAVFGVILADLDRLGYSVSWATVGACRVGACHHRHRLFVLAVRSADVAVPSSEPIAHRHNTGWAPAQEALFGDVGPVRWTQSGITQGGQAWALTIPVCGTDGAMLPTPTRADGERRSATYVRGNPTLIGALLPTPRVSATRTGRSAILGSSSSPSLDQALEIARGELPRELRSWDEAPPSWTPFPTPTARNATRGAGRTSPEGRPLSEVIALLPTPTTSDVRDAGRHGDGGPDLRTTVAALSGRFGQYERAVRRHELAFGMPVPEPTEPGRTGRPRLSAAFPEWMVGLPAGWITDVVGRNDAIRIAGNGLVGQVVAYTLPLLPTFPAAVASLTRQAVAA